MRAALQQVLSIAKPSAGSIARNGGVVSEEAATAIVKAMNDLRFDVVTQEQALNDIVEISEFENWLQMATNSRWTAPHIMEVLATLIQSEYWLIRLKEVLQKYGVALPKPSSGFSCPSSTLSSQDFNKEIQQARDFQDALREGLVVALNDIEITEVVEAEDGDVSRPASTVPHQEILFSRRLDGIWTNLEHNANVERTEARALDRSDKTLRSTIDLAYLNRETNMRNLLDVPIQLPLTMDTLTIIGESTMQMLELICWALNRLMIFVRSAIDEYSVVITRSTDARGPEDYSRSSTSARQHLVDAVELEHQRTLRGRPSRSSDSGKIILDRLNRGIF